MAQWDRSSQGVQLKTVQARAEVRGRPGSKLSGRGLIQQPYTRISGPKWVGTDFEFQHRHQWIGQLPSRGGRVQPPISEQVWYHDDSGHGVGVCAPTIVLWMPFTDDHVERNAEHSYQRVLGIGVHEARLLHLLDPRRPPPSDLRTMALSPMISFLDRKLSCNLNNSLASLTAVKQEAQPRTCKSFLLVQITCGRWTIAWHQAIWPISLSCVAFTHDTQ